MKTRPSLFTTLTLLAVATPAFAASERADNSSFLVWAFLILCGLIVVVQLLPVVFMAFGMISGIIRTKNPETNVVNK